MFFGIESLQNNCDENENSLDLSIDSCSGNDAVEELIVNSGTLTIACTNAQSVVEKVDSLVTLFEEMGLHFALLTETWLTHKLCSRRKLEDLTVGGNVSFIRKDRSTRGGGIAIAFNPTKTKLTKFAVPQNYLNTEVVCTVGSTPLSSRKIALISVYMPPAMKKADLDGYIYTLIDLVDSILL